MSYTHSESPGRALSHDATQFMSYTCKKMSKSRFRDPSEQGFLRFSELGSPDYIVKTAIFSVWVFLMISVHGNTLYAIAIHKNRSLTPFLTLWSHFENWTKNLLSILQLLRTCHNSIGWGITRTQNLFSNFLTTQVGVHSTMHLSRGIRLLWSCWEAQGKFVINC